MPKLLTPITALTAVTVVTLFCCTLPSRAQSTYPESALEEAYRQEITEKTKLEDLERKAVREKADYDRKVSEIEQQIKVKNLQTESYKIKSEEIHSQLEALRAEIFEFNAKHRTTDNDYQSYEIAYKKLNSEQEEYSRQFADLKYSLEKKQKDLSKLRQKYELSSAKYKSDKEKMRQAISGLEIEIAAADSKRAEYESEEMKNRVEWLAITKENQDKKTLKASYLADAAEAKKKLDIAKHDLTDVQVETNKLSYELTKLAQQSQRDIQAYEKGLIDATRKKALLETEKIRVDSEKEKLQRYVAHVKETLDSSVKSFEVTQSALIESRLALESVKSDLTKVIADSQKSEFEQQKNESRVRGLASAEQLAQIADDKRLFTLNKDCPAMRSPASDSETAFSVNSGQQFLGTTSGAKRWVKVSVEGKKPVYIDKNCGRFQD